MTLATVGYSDFAPKTDLGKIFIMLCVFIRIGLLVAIFTQLAEALLAAQRDQLTKLPRRNQQRIEWKKFNGPSYWA